MTHSVDLKKEDIERIKKFRYQTCGLTIVETTFYEPYWNFIANRCLPDWLAPNALTLMGLIFPIVTMAVMAILTPGFDQVLPGWVWGLAFFGTFWFQTIDAVDGKQARRIDNCSPMGQILDHSLDQITATSIMLHASAIMCLGSDINRIMLIIPGVMSAHFSIEFRTHFTNFHNTVVGFIGATEQLIFIQFGTLLPLFLKDSNTIYSWPLELPFEVPFLSGM